MSTLEARPSESDILGVFVEFESDDHEECPGHACAVVNAKQAREFAAALTRAADEYDAQNPPELLRDVDGDIWKRGDEDFTCLTNDEVSNETYANIVECWGPIVAFVEQS